MLFIKERKEWMDSFKNGSPEREAVIAYLADELAKTAEITRNALTARTVAEDPVRIDFLAAWPEIVRAAVVRMASCLPIVLPPGDHRE